MGKRADRSRKVESHIMDEERDVLWIVKTSRCLDKAGGDIKADIAADTLKVSGQYPATAGNVEQFDLFWGGDELEEAWDNQVLVVIVPGSADVTAIPLMRTFPR